MYCKKDVFGIFLAAVGEFVFEFGREHLWIELLLAIPYLIKFILQVGAIETGDIALATVQNVIGKLSRCEMLVVELFGHRHAIDEFAVFLTVGATVALISSLLIYHKQYTGKFLK